MNGTTKDAERLRLEYELDALNEAKHILETNYHDKYPPHFLNNPAYQRVISHVCEQIKNTRDTIATLDRLG